LIPPFYIMFLAAARHIRSEPAPRKKPCALPFRRAIDPAAPLPANPTAFPRSLTGYGYSRDAERTRLAPMTINADKKEKE
jgi:hypothetical protein